MSETIAIVAPGEMGSAVGARLVEQGARVVTSLQGRSKSSAVRAQRAGLAVAESDEALVAAADFVLSIVPPGEAVGLARRLAPALKQAPGRPVYVDCNAISPKTAERIGGLLGGTECRYVDGGIIGPPPAAGGRTVLYVAGEGANEVLRLARLGLDVRVVDGGIGAASALKMSYAGITKGLTALGTAMMLGATRADVADALGKELAESQPQLLAYLARSVPAMFPKASRWVSEMEEISQFLAEDAAAEHIYRGIARLYARLATEVGGTPDSLGHGELAQLVRFCRKVSVR
jgi:3-hydroxyisobutyrate dehydrogenase-like beta-hydroxyacid dehydrogenase